MKGIWFRFMTHRLPRNSEFTLSVPYKTPTVVSIFEHLSISERYPSIHTIFSPPHTTSQPDKVSYKMFLLEKLAPELILMIMKEVISLDKDVDKRATPRKSRTGNLSALIFASPVSLRLYNASPSLVLHRLSSLTQWALPRKNAALQAYNAANLRLGLAAWEGPREAQVQKVVKPHIKRMMWFNHQLDLISSREIAADFGSLVLRGEYDLFLQSRCHLAEYLDLASRARGLGSRLMNYLHSRLADQFHHERPDWEGCIRINLRSIRRTTREDLHEPLLRFQTYCDTFFRHDHVLADNASMHRKAFFTRYDEDSVYDRTYFDNSDLGRQRWHNHELFHVVLHYIFEEHKSIIRNVARGLGATTLPNASRDGNRTEQDNTLALESNATRRGQILRLHNRTVVMEDGYCRYMTSFGLDLVDQLLRMSPDDKQEYVLTEFSRFSLTQEPQACFLENTADICKWDPNGSSGRRWQDSKDRSRMAYTAWYWELAHRAQVGTNFG